MSAHASTRALKVLVHGRVQGVGFRFFVRDNAQALGLMGWTRNLADGRTLEVVAEGSTDALETLLGKLRKGPPGARVEQIDEEWSAPQGDYQGFEIRQ